MTRVGTIFLNAAILILGIAAFTFFSWPFWGHVGQLRSHLASGTWEVITDRPQIEKFVRGHYKDAAQRWEISFVASNANSFPLDERHVEPTIVDIGHKIVSDAQLMQFKTVPLQVAYGAMLADMLQVIGEQKNEVEDDPLNSLSKAIQAVIERPSQHIDQDKYKRAGAALAKLPKMSVLRDAINSFQNYEMGRGLEFPAFQIATNPSFGDNDTWYVNSTILEQSGRCLGTVSSTADAATQLGIDIKFFPRLIEIEFERPWLSDALLNEASSEFNQHKISKYFASDGDLRIIPWRLWVLMPETLSFNLVNKGDEPVLSRWIQDLICCQFICNAEKNSVVPTSVYRSEANEEWRGKRAGLPPLLYAIISRRR